MPWVRGRVRVQPQDQQEPGMNSSLGFHVPKEAIIRQLQLKNRASWLRSVQNIPSESAIRTLARTALWEASVCGSGWTAGQPSNKCYRRRDLRGKEPTSNGSSGPFAASAWIMSSYSANALCIGHSRRTALITIGGELTWARQRRTAVPKNTASRGGCCGRSS